MADPLPEATQGREASQEAAAPNPEAAIKVRREASPEAADQASGDAVAPPAAAAVAAVV